LEPFVLVGHSMGAFISAHYASRFKQNVKALFLLSPAGMTADPDEGKSVDERLKKLSWPRR
jgi:cardiolipin-specific phospholipase